MSSLLDWVFRRRALLEALEPRRSFADLVVPEATRRQLAVALLQIRHHDRIFRDWGLGERHPHAQGLAFHFAGPPGTGKTLAAEAVAFELGRRLLVVRYAELESVWAGETGRNVAAVFREAQEQDAVLFFDEADAIAARRFRRPSHGYEREANLVVNVLLRELERFPGVVIFATNLADNLDPAFERRIRTHVRFERPGPAERERIWRLQIHAEKTPLAPDVDFRALAERYEATGGDIRNAVLKAALLACAEPAAEGRRAIAQRHFEAAIEEVLAARRVMRQHLEEDEAPLGGAEAALGAVGARLAEVEDRLTALEGRLGAGRRRRRALTARLAALEARLRRLERAAALAAVGLGAALLGALLALGARLG